MSDDESRHDQDAEAYNAQSALHKGFPEPRLPRSLEINDLMNGDTDTELNDW